MSSIFVGSFGNTYARGLAKSEIPLLVRAIGEVFEDGVSVMRDKRLMERWGLEARPPACGGRARLA